MGCRRIVMCVVSSLVLAFSALSQQKQLPKTFLWRISGNGLSKPSFLYGTIHLSDKRLFNFSDSLYHYLEQAEGFNIELDADSMIAVSVRMWTEKDKGRTLKSMLKKNEYDKYAAKLSKTLHKPADKITTKDIWVAKNKKTAEAYKKGDIFTFMDLYLYSIARRQGKTVGGIEDIEDQAGIIDEMVDEMDVEFLVSDTLQKEGNSMIERMKNIYITQDLNQVQSLFNTAGNSKIKDLLLIKRNGKMARRMDSLSHIRSSFFAVGVAHLPGDSGVIDLLQKRGFKVEPVFSTKKIAPANYSYKEVAVPWVKFTHDLQLYNVELPGALQPMDMYKQVMDMRYYYDLSTAKAYFTAVVNSAVDSTKKDSVFTGLIKRMAAEGNVISKKTIAKQNFEGRDVTIKTSDGEMLHMNLYVAEGLVYLVMVSSKDAQKLNDNDSKRFFASFSMTPHPSFSKPYISFSDTAAAFSVSLPDQPAIAEEEETDEAGYLKTFSSHDYGTGNFFIVSMRNTKAGNYIVDDSIYLNLVKNGLANAFLADTVSNLTGHNGYPALAMNGTAKDENAYYRTLTVVRGNRTYTLMAASQKDTSGVSADNFFKSFRLLNYPASDWGSYNAPDNSFTAWLPAAFNSPKEEAADDTSTGIPGSSDSLSDKKVQARSDFLSYNKSTANSYYIARSAFKDYFWAANDTALFQSEAKQLMAENDSILSFKFSTTGNDPVADYEIGHATSSIVKKVRLILHGDSLYKVYSYAPRLLLNDANNQKFFSSFTISSPARPVTVFNNKTSLLVADLASTDSAVFEKASAYLYDANLPEAELHAFYPLLVKPLRDFSENYYNTNVKLTDKVAEIADSSTVDFIVEHYPSLQGESKKLQYPLLKLLLEMKQPYAGEAVKELLKRSPAPAGNPSVFTSALYDSLPFAKVLFPQFITFTTDTTAALDYAYLIKRLIDSSLITKDEVSPYLGNFITSADQQRKKIKGNDDEFDYNLNSIIDLFGTINNAETNAQLQLFSNVNNLDIRYSAIEWLLKNKQPVNAEVVQKLASSNRYRTEMYEALKTAKRTASFPAAFLNQKMFAASYVHSYASEEDSYPGDIQFLMEKTVNYKGRKQKFYLFKVSFNEGEDASHSLGIAGPFSLDIKKITSKNEATGVYWKEPFSAGKINLQFNEYLKQLETGD